MATYGSLDDALEGSKSRRRFTVIFAAAVAFSMGVASVLVLRGAAAPTPQNKPRFSSTAQAPAQAAAAVEATSNSEAAGAPENSQPDPGHMRQKLAQNPSGVALEPECVTTAPSHVGDGGCDGGFGGCSLPNPTNKRFDGAAGWSPSVAATGVALILAW